MSHIRFDDAESASGLDDWDPDDSRALFKDLERSRLELKRQIEELSKDASRCFGRFVLLKTVETSGAGALHKAWDPRDQRHVAVRTVPNVGPLSREAQKVLETATLLRHGNVLSPLPGGYGVQGGILYIAMELSADRSLEPRKGEEVKRDPHDAARLVRDLSRALAYAQGLGLVHGALHPASILIDARGTPRLLDWGVAEAEARSEKRQVRLVARLERGGCRAPEVGLGMVGDPLADIYALGALLLRLVAGKLPSGLTPDEEGPDDDLPALLEPIVRRCLDPEPTGRYPTAFALARDLDRWLAGQRPEAADVPLSRRFGKRLKQVVGKLADDIRELSPWRGYPTGQ
jgi:serine/threonine protein kinase